MSFNPDVAAKRSLVYRCVLFGLAAGTTLLFSALFYHILASDGWLLLDVVLLPLFTILLFWVSIGFWMATVGAMFRYDVPSGQASRRDVSDDSHVARPLPRTAIVVPIYNEPTGRVFAGLAATWRSLQLTPDGFAFDLFILSDTTDPDIQLAEERAWADFLKRYNADGRVFYRHRINNTERKTGNIKDFCERWGGKYLYMIVFDADSVMAGPTLVEMVCRMQRDPKLGILQTVPRPVLQTSLFGRAQQFAAGAYGHMFAAGFSLWSHGQGNYFGHNAIIRTQPFIDHCGLPVLPGKPPLGGHILSHDFVEAALMVSAGYHVVLADDLAGSYEQCPDTLIDFAKRDQRWCQGNLQHLKLVMRRGMHPFSRGHMLVGVMSYASSLVWLSFMVVGFGAALSGQGVELLDNRASSGMMELSVQTQALLLFGLTLLLLLTPKLWALVLLPRRPAISRMGSEMGVLGGILMETLVSVFTAPILMMFHARFVVNTLLGRSVTWDAQRRDAEGTTWAEAASVHRTHTLIGVIGLVLATVLTPGLMVWTIPVLGPLALSIPLSVLVSHPGLGRWLQRRGILTIPEETHPPRELFWLQQDLDRYQPPAPGELFPRLLADPSFMAMHLAIVEASGPTRVTPPDWVSKVDRLTPQQRREFLADPLALRAAHRQAWLTQPTDRLASTLGLTATPVPVLPSGTPA